VQSCPTEEPEPPQEKELQEAGHQKRHSTPQDLCNDVCGKNQVKRNQSETAWEVRERSDLLAGEDEERKSHGGGAGGGEDSLGRGHRKKSGFNQQYESETAKNQEQKGSPLRQRVKISVRVGKG